MKLSWRPLPVCIKHEILDLMNSEHLTMILFAIKLGVCVEPSWIPYIELFEINNTRRMYRSSWKSPTKIYSCIMVYEFSVSIFLPLSSAFHLTALSVIFHFFFIFKFSIYQSPSFACLSCHNIFLLATMETTMPLKRKLLLWNLRPFESSTQIQNTHKANCV